MLTEEKNRLLTRVESGAPMGDLLRRYWQPIGAVDALQRESIKPVRLFGENLVLYRDLGGRYGLIARKCAHRGADLAYGYVEENGLRCSYHGWVYGEHGGCLQQPFEEIAMPSGRMRERIRLPAYPVRVRGGLLWTYMGPDPAPPLPNWEPFSWENGFTQIVFADVPCNWLQCQENSIDPVHFEWMHSNWTKRLRHEPGPYAPRHIKLDFQEFDYGLLYKRVREDTSEDHPLWTVGRVCLWPNGFFLGDHFEWRVPVDDEHTLSITWSFTRVPREREPYVQGEIPSWTSPVRDPETGRFIATHVINQDIVAWVGQGVIADRTTEHLGASDRGVYMLRQRLFADLERIARNEDPSGVNRSGDPDALIPLPVAARDVLLSGLPTEDYLRHPLWGKVIQHFPFHAGQPDAVKRAYEHAMGFAVSDRPLVDA